MFPTASMRKRLLTAQSIDLTRLPSGPTTGQDNADTPSFRYSSREISPPHLLIQQLRRAHSIFHLHHGSTLDLLYRRAGKSTFCALLERFWTKFAWTWEVLLSGNPAVDVYNGIKLSGGGELGVGVGEEEWGSGERAVLEDFVTGTEGLVDLVVSRFGDPPAPAEDTVSPKKSGDLSASGDGERQWLGTDNHPRPSDGVIFSGLGAISRDSLAHISQWMEWVYRYGEDTYGVEDPTATRSRNQRRKRSKVPSKDFTAQPGSANTSQPTQERSFSPGIPRPLVMGNLQPPQGADAQGRSQISGESSPSRSERGSDWSGLGSETFRKVFMLGYGSTWSFSSMGSNAREKPPDEAKQSGSHGSEHAQEGASETGEATPIAQPSGRFIIGLRDDIRIPGEQPEAKGSADNPRIRHKTLHIRLSDPSEQSETGLTPQRALHRAKANSINPDTKLQAVIYVHQPFMYTFLFDPETPSLSQHALYSTIHHHLTALHKPLSTSTSPETAAARISASDTSTAITDPSTRFSPKQEHQHSVYELVYDPKSQTTRSSIPNIPDLHAYPAEVLASGGSDPRSSTVLPWSRVESLTVHHRILNTYLETRSRPRELERTCKMGRGWWIVWVRMLDLSSGSSDRDEGPNADADDPPQEAFLIRKASDYAAPVDHSRGAARFLRDLGGSSPSSGWQSSSRGDTAPGKIVEGLGLDARRYIENLLSLNR